MTSTMVPPLPDRPAITIRSPADLIACLPYVLGFHPHDSMVLAAFRQGQVMFAARSDLPGPDTPGGAELARELVAVAARQRPDSLTAVGYGEAAAVDDQLQRVRSEAERHQLPLDDMLRVHDGRWWSYRCQQPNCCPPEGTPFDPAAREVTAQLTLAGLSAAPSRDQLAERVAPVTGPARQAIEHATEHAERELAEWLEGLPVGQRTEAIAERGDRAVTAALARATRGERLDDQELAQLSLLLMATTVRDAAWRAITSPEPHIWLWTDVTKRAATELVAAPASLLGFAAWRSGNGALARLALERALAADPTYSMAQLLLTALHQGVPPASLEGWCTGAAEPA